MKRQLIAAGVLSLVASATTYGHISDPIEPVPQDEFKSIKVPKSDKIVPILVDIHSKYDKSGLNRPKSSIKGQIKPKIGVIVKSVPVPKSAGGKQPSRAKIKAWTRAQVNNDTQFACLDKLWWKESAWRWNAGHPSRAYGIPQAYPGSKMAREGSDWLTNPITQVKWGLKYIKRTYDSMCDAWNHSKRYNWY